MYWLLRDDVGGTYRKQYPFILAQVSGSRSSSNVMYECYVENQKRYAFRYYSQYPVGDDYEMVR